MFNGLARSIPLALTRGMHGFPQVGAELDVQPEVGSGAEHAGENERGPRRHLAARGAQFVDVLTLNAHRPRQGALGLRVVNAFWSESEGVW